VSRTSIAERGAAYGLPSIAVDGNDVLAVHKAACEAVGRARAGEGPTLLECRTYRTRAHSEGARDVGYRTVEEVETWKERGPITRFKEHLLAEQLVTEEDLARIDAEVNAEVDEAQQFAASSPWPDPATVLDHVYST
jgi:TPP-dependent pyruvate/acetoin dehydrogenase alpha subunit